MRSNAKKQELVLAKNGVSHQSSATKSYKYTVQGARILSYPDVGPFPNSIQSGKKGKPSVERVIGFSDLVEKEEKGRGGPGTRKIGGGGRKLVEKITSGVASDHYTKQKSGLIKVSLERGCFGPT